MSSAFSEKPKKKIVPDHPIGCTCEVGISELNFGTKKFLHSANLQATILAARYLNHSTVPKSTRTLLPDLEAIKQLMVEKKGANLKAKGKGGTTPSEPKGNPKRKASGGPTGQVLKKGCTEKFCQRCKAHGGPFTRHNTLDCRCYDSNGKPLQAAAGKLSESKKPYKKSGGNKSMAFMQSMFKAYVKSQKKAGKSKKCKKHDYDSSDTSDSE